jgi:uncharacterized repeat protein (TIGR01451 family)
MIFDAECVGGCSGGDDDLFFPGHGKTMINSEDLDSTDPDDQDQTDSFMEFDFNGIPGIVTVDSIDVGDVEDREAIDAYVEFHHGICPGHPNPIDEDIRFPLPITGDHAIQTVTLGAANGFSGTGCLHVHLNGSGTVDNIRFTVTDTPEPGIQIEKATNGEDADDPPGPTLIVGDPVTWTYVVTNTGDVELTGVQVTDDMIGAVTCPQDTLGVGDSMTCTAEGTVEAGQYANLGTACGIGAELEFCDEDPSHYIGEEPPTGGEGCTPGFWKQSQHFDSWVGHSPDELFSDVFGEVITVNAGGRNTITDPTLLEALNANGGGINALARHAVAALLNAAATPDISFDLTEAEVIDLVQDAIESGDLESVKDELAELNEQGCPLS